MARVELSPVARDALARLIDAYHLPADTERQVRARLEPLQRFPEMGTPLFGSWEGFRFISGPWPWMLLLYMWSEEDDLVMVVTIRDARSSVSPLH